MQVCYFAHIAAFGGFTEFNTLREILEPVAAVHILALAYLI